MGMLKRGRPPANARQAAKHCRKAESDGAKQHGVSADRSNAGEYVGLCCAVFQAKPMAMGAILHGLLMPS
jgi:hypothetical protein